MELCPHKRQSILPNTTALGLQPGYSTAGFGPVSQGLLGNSFPQGPHCAGKSPPPSAATWRGLPAAWMGAWDQAWA